MGAALQRHDIFAGQGGRGERNRATGAAVLKRWARGCVGWLLLWLGSSAAHAAPVDPWAPFGAVWFNHVTVADGLPHPTTTSMVQDRRGLVWIGTVAGLVRYDGYHMQVFGSKGSSLAAFPDAYVRALAALPDGGLLIGTNAGGLLRYDAMAQTFQAYPIGAGGTASAKIFAMSPEVGTADRGFWIATDAGLDHLDTSSGALRHVPLSTGAVDTVVRSFAVLQDRRGDLWVGSGGGLLRRAAGTQTFAAVNDADPLVASVLHDQVWSILEDREGRLWVGTLRSGMVYRDPQGHWHAPPPLAGTGSLLQRRTVRGLLQAADGNLWIATDGAGVVVYDPTNDHARVLQHDPAVPSSLSGSVARALLQDRSDNIWVATELGASIYDPRPHAVLSVLASPLEPKTLAMPDVYSILVDARGRIWLGLGRGRIDVLDLAQGSMRHLELLGEQDDSDVQAMSVAPDGSIWAGSKGVARIDPDSFEIRSSQIPALDPQTILFMQRDGANLLIGTYDGVYRYDPATARMEHFRHDQADPNSLVSDQVRNGVRMLGAWWYLTVNGISIAEDGASRFRTIRHDPADPHSLPQNYVDALALDSHQRLWVGTYNGLAWADHAQPAESYRFHRIGIPEGLENDKVNAILIDHADRVWASLESGLAMVDRALKVHMLGPRDGLHILNYVHSSAAVTPQGDLLFGGLGGLTVLRPQALQPWPVVPELAVTYASIGQRMLAFGRLPAAGEPIELGSHERSLYIAFALLEYRALSSTQYSYRMQGLESGWTDIPYGTPPVAIYTNLPHGEYTLQLRAVTQGADARTIETAVRVVVQPRWYETGLAGTGLVLLGVFAFFGLVYLRTRYLHHRAARLQEEVELRTYDLKLANQRLDQIAGTDELTSVYNRRRFLELAERVRTLALEQQGGFCMLLIDLDEFKRVNDTYGHLAGDQVLRSAVQAASTLCRPPWLLGRYGGEELVLCLPGVDSSTAMRIAERIRVAVAETEVQYEGMTIRITVSIGAAAWQSPESLQALLGRADKALYAAKHAGRNTCMLAEETPA